MAGNVKIKRDASVRLMISAETKARLDKLSAAFGVPPATLASVWLGGVIAQQENALGVTARFAETLGGELGEAFRESLGEQGSLLGGKGGR